MKPTLTNLTERRKDAVAVYDAMMRKAIELNTRIQAQSIRIAGITEQIGKASNADAHQPV